MTASIPVPPHRYYYLHNFERALAWIAQRYSDLLDSAEHDFLAQFAALPPLSRALLVRMLMRRGPWFRASKLVYEEIPEVSAAADPLLALGWLDTQAPMLLEELFDLHTKGELATVFAGAERGGGTRKSDWLLALGSQHAEPRRYAEWHPKAAEPVWRVMLGALSERLRLMFFGNLHQDWTEFVLADLGVFKYESVDFDASSRAFQTREDIDAYLALQACREALEEGGDAAALRQAIDACRSSNPWLEKRRAKLLLRLGNACERAAEWDEALLTYAQCSYPGARHRYIRVLERLERHEEALQRALAAQQAPESDEEQQKLLRMLPRLQRSLGQGPPGRRPGAARALLRLRSDIELDPPALPMSVEYVLRQHWHSDASPVFYVENALVNSLFGLLCWPAIFAPVQGAFFHPFQSAPADLSAPDFAQRRADEFARCLALLDAPDYMQVICERYADKQGVQSPFVFWGVLTEPLLRLALDCISAAHLKLLFTRLMADVKANRTGFPDLVRFWPGERRYELVEVKGPGDKLQDNQIRWLEYCSAHGIPVSVCHVQWRSCGAAP
ncbi:VRR-NUC domain-containing protein [Comamonas antarctica]|uniref:VRR-NUC domain-containing protein n=1 Tax=Comamonas antarctica TaxID=2743470 RepID=UPI0028E77E91|nr:VRR-NUC domain-containing protein [Comamonas antarctica]